MGLAVYVRVFNRLDSEHVERNAISYLGGNHMNMFIFMTILNACRFLLEFQGKISPDLRFLVFTFVLFTVRWRAVIYVYYLFMYIMYIFLVKT